MTPTTSRDDDGPPPPLVMGNALDMVMPIIAFLALNRFAGLAWAIGGATVFSLKAAYSRKRRGLAIGKLLPVITIGILARGLVGILTDSEAVYFGIGIGTKAAVGLALIVTPLIGRNQLAAYAPMVFGFDGPTVRSPQYRVAMDHISMALGVGQIVSSVFDVWLFNSASVNGYLIIRFLVNWPFTTALVFGSLAYLGRRLRSLDGFPGMSALLEARMEQHEAAARAKRSGTS